MLDPSTKIAELDTVGEGGRVRADAESAREACWWGKEKAGVMRGAANENSGMDRAQGWRHHLIPLPYWPPLLFSPPDQSRPPLSFPGHYERWRFPLPELLLPSSTVIFRPPRSASQGAIELVTRWTGKVHGPARGCSGWLAWLGPRARWKTQIIPSVYPSTNEINTPLIHSEQGLGVSSLPIACAQSFRPFIRRHVLVSQFRVGRDLGAASLVSVIRPLSLTGGGGFVDWGGRISWMAECHLERPVEGPQWW